MIAHVDFTEKPPYKIQWPSGQRVAFVFSSPHSGRYYPERFLKLGQLDPQAIRRSEDCFVDQLFSGVTELGAPLLSANFPRAYVDVNREPWELDPLLFRDPVPNFANSRSARVAGGLGTIPRIVGEGQNIYRSQLPMSEAISRIKTVYYPFHECLGCLMNATHKEFGHAVLVDCHSMPSTIRNGCSDSHPDFIIGDRFGTAASRNLSSLAIGLLREMGYKVGYNNPYAGGFITEYYGQPVRKRHALQIEINRALYLDETSYSKNDGYNSLEANLLHFANALTSIPLEHLDDVPVAAE